MTSRDNILRRLRAARQPFTDVPPLAERRPMVPVEETSAEALQARFVRAAEKLGCTVHEMDDPAAAVRWILGLIGTDSAIQCWEFDRIPLPGLAAALREAGIRLAPGNAAVRIGITGVDAALAGTGSLVLTTGAGKPRQASLLPPVHVAVVARGQIVPHFEAWVAAQRAHGLQTIHESSGVAFISGPSRTGDIANIPVMGVHGPGAVHVVIV